MKLQLKVWFLENKEQLFFVLKFFFIYLLANSIYQFFIQAYTSIDQSLIDLIISNTEFVLDAMNFDLIEDKSAYSNYLGIMNSSGVIIGDPCDGLKLFILFSTFIIVFKGKLYAKLIFIGIGITIIHFLNILRIVSLAIIALKFPHYLDFHHSYTFTLTVYLCIFLMWVFRVKIFSTKNF